MTSYDLRHFRAALPVRRADLRPHRAGGSAATPSPTRLCDRTTQGVIDDVACGKPPSWASSCRPPRRPKRPERVRWPRRASPSHELAVSRAARGPAVRAIPS